MIRVPDVEQQIQAVEAIEQLLEICDGFEPRVLSKNDLPEKFSSSVALFPA